jgi:hypothetical protein
MPKIERKHMKEKAQDSYNTAHALLRMSDNEDLSDQPWLGAMYDLATQLEGKVMYLKKKLGHQLGVPKAE